MQRIGNIGRGRTSVVAFALLAVSLAGVAACGSREPPPRDRDRGAWAGPEAEAPPPEPNVTPPPLAARPAASDGPTDSLEGLGSTEGSGQAGSGDGAGPFTGTVEATDKPKKASASATAKLVRVRSAAHDGYDRVVFEFEGKSVPAYRVEFVAKPSPKCGSGDAPKVAGAAWLAVKLSGAAAHGDDGKPSVQAREIATKHPAVRELELTCDFEAEVAWVIGASAKTGYRVLELESPARLVVDVLHPAK